MLAKLLTLALVTSTGLSQTTWIVDQSNGPGANFTSLPAAVAAAASGDTLLVRPAPFLGAYAPFTTDKGITVIGEGFVQIATNDIARIRIENVPSGATFQLINLQAARGGHMAVDIVNCAGRVHLEELRSYESGPFGPVTPGLDIVDSDSVSMRRLEVFGVPAAVRADNSRLEINDCGLGVGAIGIGLGQPLTAQSSDLEITQPRFRSLGALEPAISLNLCLFLLPETKPTN